MLELTGTVNNISPKQKNMPSQHFQLTTYFITKQVLTDTRKLESHSVSCLNYRGLKQDIIAYTHEL